MKRLSYEKVRISTFGGVIECKPSTDGWAVIFERHVAQPPVGYGKTIEEAGSQLVEEMKRAVHAIEEDLKAFVERNK